MLSWGKIVGGRTCGLGFAAPTALATGVAARAPPRVCRLHAQTTTMMAARRMPAVVRALVPSPELRRFVPDRAQPRSEILKILSKYAKDKGLQHPDNKTIVVCDPPLEKLLGVKECSFLSISKYVTPHLSKPEDVGGKYLEQARLHEVNWLKENADKPPSEKRRVSRKRSEQNEEARMQGKGLWLPVRLTPALAKVCGDRSEMPRQEILKAVWQYIRIKDLQKGPGQPIVCDAAMKAVFDTDSLSARQIMGGIAPHVIKK